MRYESLQDLCDEEFRRLTGVKPSMFKHMVEILSVVHRAKRWHGGRSSKLCIEDQLLITLEYLREYRTYFHIGTSYGISESSAYKAIKWVEDTLIKHPNFALPGKKALIDSDSEGDIVLMDVSESPIQRPKKSKKDTTPARKSDIA
jgi:hypothetical protein